jgi:CO/xanthine dehydrogenase Mo-binding subunit
LPGSLKANPRLGQWLRVDPSGCIEIAPGKVEIGQGILTALAQIAADELDVSLARIRLKPANTAESPNEGVTAGSLSIQDSGSAIRHVCAEVRSLSIAAAAARLGVPVSELAVEDGQIRGPGNLATSYWELADDIDLDRDATPGNRAKLPAARKIAGASTARIDLPAKVFGQKRFIHDTLYAGVLHGRVIRPAGPAARLLSLDEQAASKISGVVAVIHDGSFIGVVAESELAAVRARDALAKTAKWSDDAQLPDIHGLADWIKSRPLETIVIAEKPAATEIKPAKTIRREFTRPYTAHASIGTSCAVAKWQDGKLNVWTHCQGIYNLRADLALVFQMPQDDIVVEHREGAGCYGHNGADDVGLDAALLARAVPGRQVRVAWSREEELAWGPLSPAMAIAVEADLDDAGEIQQWRFDLWSNGHATRPGRGDLPTLLSGYHLEKAFPMVPGGNMPLAAGGGADRNAVPAYTYASQRITNHRLLEMPIRTSALRSLGAFANVFAIESMMDILAAEIGEDPVAFRLRHLEDARGRAVIEAAAARSNWGKVQREDGVGHGIGYAKYKNLGAWCAVVAEVECGRDIRVRKLTIAVDVGEVINPDGVINQIEGGAIQATSHALKEAVTFDRQRITSDSWETYPILKFSEIPAVDVEIINRPGERPLGAGEGAHGPTVAAIANAIADAMGVRIYDLPLTADRLIAAINAD